MILAAAAVEGVIRSWGGRQVVVQVGEDSEVAQRRDSEARWGAKTSNYGWKKGCKTEGE